MIFKFLPPWRHGAAIAAGLRTTFRTLNAKPTCRLTCVKRKTEIMLFRLLSPAWLVCGTPSAISLQLSIQYTSRRGLPTPSDEPEVCHARRGAAGRLDVAARWLSRPAREDQTRLPGGRCPAGPASESAGRWLWTGPRPRLRLGLWTLNGLEP